jgi:hypothetical protein
MKKHRIIDERGRSVLATDSATHARIKQLASSTGMSIGFIVKIAFETFEPKAAEIVRLLEVKRSA